VSPFAPALKDFAAPSRPDVGADTARPCFALLAGCVDIRRAVEEAANAFDVFDFIEFVDITVIGFEEAFNFRIFAVGMYVPLRFVIVL
jgi:hypothetical protein